MTTNTGNEPTQRGLFPWGARATYAVGKTRRQRQTQHKNQMNILLMTLGGAFLAGLIVVYINYLGAGSTKSVNCEDYPEFCVPLAGGATGSASEFALVESETVRTITPEESNGAEGVVRGVGENNMPFIGNPDAPIHFAVMADYACSHCQDFHYNDLDHFIEDYVLTGKATVHVGLMTGTGGASSQTASQATMCAAEQGAFWEFQDEMYRLARSMYVTDAFSIGQLQDSADKMGIDSDELRSCIASGRYASTVDSWTTWALDRGVTGTPTVLVSYGDSGNWRRLQGAERSYENLAGLTENALASVQ